MGTNGAIEDFQNMYEGERIFVLGNGPSLAETPLDKLTTEYSLAMNQISLIYEKQNWLPTFYYYALPPDDDAVPTDQSVITRNTEKDIVCLFNSKWEPILGNRENVFYFDRWRLDNKNNPLDLSTMEQLQELPIDYLYEFWSDNAANFLYHYHTMYGVMQLVSYMGFDEIYLLGCDLGFEYVDPHMIFELGLDPYKYQGGTLDYLREAFNADVLIQSIINALAMKIVHHCSDGILNYIYTIYDNDHFSSKYDSNLNIRDGSKVETEIKKSHLVSYRILDDKNIDIYNATLGGELDIYERVDLYEIISE